MAPPSPGLVMGWLLDRVGVHDLAEWQAFARKKRFGDGMKASLVSGSMSGYGDHDKAPLASLRNKPGRAP